MRQQDLLDACFAAAVAAASPARCLAPHLPVPTGRPGHVVGAGKAAASMAEALVAAWPDVLTGCVVTRYGHGVGRPRVGDIDVIEAAHPVPDAAGWAAGRRILALAEGLAADDLLFVLLSGGASALLEVPLPGLTLSDLQSVNRQLLAAGADISAINCVRRKLSALKGGGLARAAAPARVHVLAISDVPGDIVADIGSGPCSPDVHSAAEARDILRRFGIDVPAAVAATLRADPTGPADDAAAFANVSVRVIARADDAMTAAAATAVAAGFEPVLLGAAGGEPAHRLAERHADIVRRYQRPGVRVALISGGETSVAVTGAGGRGGRNSEYLLALALALTPDGAAGVHALAADTDGIDGTEDNAGARLYPDSLARARTLGIDPAVLLAAHRAWDFFAALGDLVVSGPTRTNVNDLRVILVTDPTAGTGPV